MPPNRLTGNRYSLLNLAILKVPVGLRNQVHTKHVLFFAPLTQRADSYIVLGNDSRKVRNSAYELPELVIIPEDLDLYRLNSIKVLQYFCLWLKQLKLQPTCQPGLRYIYQKPFYFCSAWKKPQHVSECHFPAKRPMPDAALTLDPEGFVQLGGQPLRLSPKARAVLSLLLRRQPAVVAKDDFARTAWQGGQMSDESLARSISQLRHILAPQGWVIEAVYGIGYRLSLTPKASAQPALPSSHVASSAPASVVDAYLHARQLATQRTPEALERAITLLRGLLLNWPQYTPAAVALADALGAAIGWGLSDTDAAVAEGLQALDAAEQARPATGRP